jgi:hypothetical protein
LILEKPKLFSLSRFLPSSPATSRSPTALLPHVRALFFSSFRNDNNNNSANKKGKETGARLLYTNSPSIFLRRRNREKQKQKTKTTEITAFIQITTRELKVGIAAENF